MTTNRSRSATTYELARSLRPLRAVVAEDDREMRRFLVAWLRDFGWEVKEACNGRELRSHLVDAALDQEVPDLVVTDVHMPEEGGLEVLAALSRTPLSVTVIVITADRSMATARQAKALGATSVLNKPFDLRTFSALIRAIAARGLT